MSMPFASGPMLARLVFFREQGKGQTPFEAPTKFGVQCNELENSLEQAGL